MPEEGFLGWMSGAIVAIVFGIGLWLWGANVSDVNNVAWSAPAASAALKSP